jgi:hypothetical protein
MSEPFSVAPGIGPYTPQIVGGTGTTAKIFPNLLANTSGIPTTFGSGSPAPTSPIAASAVTIPGTGQYEQQQIAVAAAGYVFVHGTSPTINIVFQQGTSLTPGSNTTMATLSSVQSLTTAATYPWAFNCRLQGDSVSGVLQIMSANFYCNGVAGSFTLTDLTGVNLTTTGYFFVLGVTFGVSDALNKAALSQFSLTVA